MANDGLSGELNIKTGRRPRTLEKNERLALQAASVALLAARASFSAMIFLAPLRYRILLASRPTPPVYTDYTNFLLFAADPFLVCTLVFWGLSLIFYPRQISLKPVGLTIGVGGLALAALASTIFSIDQALSLFNAAHLLLLFGLYLFILNEIQNLAWVYIPAGFFVLVQSLVGITQVLRQHSLGLSVLQELILDPTVKGVSIVWTSASSTLRAYGLTDHPNILGGCLAIGLLFIAAWYLDLTDRFRPLAVSGFALGLVGLLLTFSRSAYLALASGLLVGVAGILLARRKEAFIHWSFLGLASLVVVAPFLWKNANYLGTRFNYDNSFTNPTPENQSINERILLDEQAIHLIIADPLTGVGVGTFPVALWHANPTYPFDYQPPHFVLVDVIAETGIPGGLFYLLAELSPWVYLGLHRKEIHFTPSLLAVCGVILAASMISLFDYYPWMLETGRLLQWLAWGLFGGVILKSMEKKEHVQ